MGESISVAYRFVLNMAIQELAGVKARIMQAWSEKENVCVGLLYIPEHDDITKNKLIVVAPSGPAAWGWEYNALHLPALVRH